MTRYKHVLCTINRGVPPAYAVDYKQREGALQASRKLRQCSIHSISLLDLTWRFTFSPLGFFFFFFFNARRSTYTNQQQQQQKCIYNHYGMRGWGGKEQRVSLTGFSSQRRKRGRLRTVCVGRGRPSLRLEQVTQKRRILLRHRCQHALQLVFDCRGLSRS